MTLRIKDTIEGKISNATNADTVPWSGVSGKPSTFTPTSHTHDDRYYTESEVDSKLSGKANSSHTHTKSQITDFPSSMKNPNSLTISLNGTSQGAYDGSAAKSINVTPSSIGAAPASHSHNIIADMGNHNETASGTTPNAPTAGMASSSAGLYLTRSYADETAPSTYGNILNVVGAGTGQLFMGWSGNDSTSEHLYYRSHRDTSTGGWGKWNTIIDSSNIGSQSVSHANTAGSVAWTNISGRPSSMPASDVYAWAKQSSKPSYSWSEISNKPSIPSVGNGTVTITQNGATKGSFTLNQSGNATIALTDNNTVYSLPAATSSTLGGVKVGSNITNSSGTISLTKANVTAALGYTPPTSDTNTWRPEEVIISSTQPSASTCKLWIKI